MPFTYWQITKSEGHEMTVKSSWRARSPYIITILAVHPRRKELGRVCEGLGPLWDKEWGHPEILFFKWSVSCSVVSNSLWPHGARQAPLSMEFSRQEHWSGLPFPSPGNLPDPGTEPRSPHCRQILYCLSHWESHSLNSVKNKIPTNYNTSPVKMCKMLIKFIVLNCFRCWE